MKKRCTLCPRYWKWIGTKRAKSSPCRPDWRTQLSSPFSNNAWHAETASRSVPYDLAELRNGYYTTQRKSGAASPGPHFLQKTPSIFAVPRIPETGARRCWFLPWRDLKVPTLYIFNILCTNAVASIKIPSYLYAQGIIILRNNLTAYLSITRSKKLLAHRAFKCFKMAHNMQQTNTNAVKDKVKLHCKFF